MSRLDATVERIKRCDAWLSVRMNGVLRYAGLLHFFRAVSWLGNGLFWYALMLALLVQRGNEAVPAVLHMMGLGPARPPPHAARQRGTGRARPYPGMPAIAPG